jgi:hypothetical protein
VCTRGSDRALLRGPSTSPLDGMTSSSVPFMHRAGVLAQLAMMASVGVAQTPPPESPDASMVVQNAVAPFVTAEFAKRLGTLVMQQKYPGFTFTSESPTVLEKGDTWWVTFVVKEWPRNMEKLSTGLSDHLTVWIRKRDAAILAIR